MTCAQARAYAQAFAPLWHTSPATGTWVLAPRSPASRRSARRLSAVGEALQAERFTGTAAGPSPLKISS